MVRIGIVGIGFMGMIHYLAARKLKGARVTAICSRDPKKRAGDWRGIRGNFGPAGRRMDLAKIKKYAELDELLADPDIDLVDVCNPTQQHPETAIAALRARKHVLVEKALALNAIDADAMLKTANILASRANSLGVSEPQVSIEGDHEIRVDLAGVSSNAQVRSIMDAQNNLPLKLTEK